MLVPCGTPTCCLTLAVIKVVAVISFAEAFVVKKERKKENRQPKGGTLLKKERKKTDNPREGWEDGTPPPHRDFKERRVWC